MQNFWMTFLICYYLKMLVLGIETSCDETGVALYDGKNKKIIFECLFSQADKHSLYGGVVPELAARDHTNKFLPLLKKGLNDSNINLKDIDVIAYTKGPGLRGPLMVGAAFAKSLGFALDKPVIPVHHMEAHLLMAKFDAPELCYPFLTLLVSGGHTILAKVEQSGVYKILGQTIDDAVGEAFDKTAKLLGLKYPGGPEIEKMSVRGKNMKDKLPRPILNSNDYNFSFSGLKTAVLYKVNELKKEGELSNQLISNICLEFQNAAIDCLLHKTNKALIDFDLKQVVLSGGVAANKELRRRFSKDLHQGCSAIYPDFSHCTDNGTMIAFTGYEKINLPNEDNKISVNPKWSLEEVDNG